jgi:hypothetical protein
MATERHRGRRPILLAALAVTAAFVLPLIPRTVHADQAWWEPLGFAGQRVTAVNVVSGQLIVDTESGRFVSTDGGRTFSAAGSGVAEATSPGATVTSGDVVWEIRDGVVLAGRAAGALAPDPGAPSLGATAHLIAAPAALPGVVVAVGTDNHVWRRAASGSWATAFVLLPAGGLSGVPQVTSVAAFTQPLSVAVYLGVDGYGVLLTEDGGDDWIRADPGLPENVLGLAADAPTRALFAATDQGLFVHRLQAFPAPPVYHDSALYLRWLGIGLVAVIATALALLGLRRILPTTTRPGR